MSGIISVCSINALEQAAANLRSGGLVAFPTETVYGLGADASNEVAVKRMYNVKNRPANHPVIVHIARIDDVTYWAEEIPDYAISLIRDYWPGPMTLLFQRTKNAGDFITGGQDVVGIRIPAHPLAENLLAEFRKIGGMGIAAPSANRYGAVSPTDANAVSQELLEFLAAKDQIIDGGPCAIGIESTIIDCTKENPIILRPGAITSEMIEASTGIVLAPDKLENIRVPGSTKQHYSPKAKVLVSKSANPGEGFIALDDIETPTNAIRLISPRTIEEYARQLYSALRQADERQVDSVSIVPPNGDGLAMAIRDRITRASEN
ncbi:MAG: threonylcarbamoyl-AMP synthase [Actinobacteria bacterium]|jgi:L-threonylcarbamoyladenylate synthase|uniref:Threonylcarbamoyl-AMP synthase n=1 Tax=freshwater metagenome TaxID=449393 RepID=A0A6J6ET70_9ZZZZ|nr:threonylcarbamoyl-AMP synthase [Actinomycetota bacterium]